MPMNKGGKTVKCMEPTDLLKRIYEQFTMESKQGRMKNIKNPLKRLSIATGISENTL